MLTMKLSKAKGLFFDSKKVIQKVDTATRKNLSKFGAYVRTAARGSIRKRKKASLPGSPPSSHTGLLKSLIYFVYEPERKSVVIGPVKLNQKIGNAPEALEHGGTSKAQVGGRRNKKLVRTKIAARPFMQPAFDSTKKQLTPLWKNSVK